MGQAIPRQHPAVVLRSHFNQLRALLAVAMVAVVGLTAAVVILAANDESVEGPGSSAVVSAPAPTGSIRYDGGPEEGSAGVSTSQPRPTQDQAFPGLARDATAAPDKGLRYDGGPEEGTSGVVPARQPNVSPETEIKDEAGIAAAVGQSSGRTDSRGSKASDFGTSQYRVPDQPTGLRYDGGPEEGTALSGPRP
jgi:hypothetical protein